MQDEQDSLNRQHEEALTKITDILQKEDPIEIKYDSLELLKYLDGKQKLVTSLSFTPEFKKFLLECYEIFAQDPKNSDYFVDVFLISEMNELIKSEPLFQEIIGILSKNDRYKNLMIVLNKRKSKRVSFLDSKNEVIFIPKEQKSKSFGSFLPDSDVIISKFDNSKDKWVVKRLQNYFTKITPETKYQKKRENEKKREVNTNIANTFYPTSLPYITVDNNVKSIPLFNYDVKNILPDDFDISKLIKNNIKLPNADCIFNDVTSIFK